MRKMTMLVSGGIGYVLGARAGRERYEQIRSVALKVKGNPTVQATASKAADAAKEAAPVVKDKVVGAASSAAGSDSTTTNTGYPEPGLAESAYPPANTGPGATGSALS
jgi:hypothetical protein